MKRDLLSPGRFGSWSLARQFTVAGGLVMCAATLLVGYWVGKRIEEDVVRNTAHSTALYMESFITPISQDLARSDALSPGAQRALEEIFTGTPLGERVASYKIWKEGGLVAVASDPALAGQVFPPTENLRRAWAGEVRADFEDLRDEEDAAENELHLPLLEIYAPIREVWSGRIIAVAEFYEVNEQLAEDIARARVNSRLAVAAVMGGIGAALWVIVLGGSRTIDRQRAELTRRLTDLDALSRHNTALRLRVQEAARRASALDERLLRRIGADLHDGPAQQLAYAALSLDHLKGEKCPQARSEEIGRIGGAISEAIREIRQISRGLAPPDIATRPICETVAGIVDAHAARSGHPVALDCDAEDDRLSEAVKLCIFRFLQEGLSNATRHGQGRAVEVRVCTDTRGLSVRVADRGPGFGAGTVETGHGLGLPGLADRVEAIGGQLRCSGRPGGGALLEMTLEFDGVRPEGQGI